MNENKTYEITKEAVDNILHFLLIGETPKGIKLNDEVFLFLVSFYASLKVDRFKKEELYEHAALWKFIGQWTDEYAKSQSANKDDEEPLSNCCTAPFGYPGWPDNDICSSCGEHADVE